MSASKRISSVEGGKINGKSNENTKQEDASKSCVFWSSEKGYYDPNKKNSNYFSTVGDTQYLSWTQIAWSNHEGIPESLRKGFKP